MKNTIKNSSRSRKTDAPQPCRSRLFVGDKLIFDGQTGFRDDEACEELTRRLWATGFVVIEEPKPAQDTRLNKAA